MCAPSMRSVRLLSQSALSTYSVYLLCLPALADSRMCTLRRGLKERNTMETHVFFLLFLVFLCLPLVFLGSLLVSIWICTRDDSKTCPPNIP